jgi:uncharacterized protein YjiS (DUF1127 family)
MSTTIRPHFSLSKFGDLLFTRQPLSVDAARHKGLRESLNLNKFADLLFTRQPLCVEAPRHKSLLDGFSSWRARRAAEEELSSLSDRELADIGVNRENIHNAVRGADR